METHSSERLSLTVSDESAASNGKHVNSRWWNKWAPSRISVNRVEGQLSLIFSILLKAVLFTLLFGFAFLIYKGLTNDRYTLKEFAVPKTFEDGGYTGSVLAHKIQDRLNLIQKISNSVRSDSLEIASDDQPEMNVAVMGFGISLQSVIYYARDVMGKANNSIGGELTELDNELSFCLRVSGFGEKTFLQDLGGMNRREALDTLMSQVAEYVMKNIDPQSLALYQTFNNRHEEGLKTVRYIINQKNEELDWAYWTWGYILYQQQKSSEAEKKLIKATQINPHVKQYWATLGTVQRMLGKYEAAKLTLEQAVKYHPDGPNLWLNLAWTYYLVGEIEKATPTMRKAVAIHPDQFYLHINLGEIQMQTLNYYSRINPDTTFRTEDTLQIIEAYRNGYITNPENSNGALSLAQGFQFAQKIDSMQKMLDLAIELDPENGWAWRIKVTQAFTDSNFTEVLALGDTAIKAFYEMERKGTQGGAKYREQEILNYMAMASYSLKQYDVSLDQINRAIALDPNVGFPYTTKAEAYAYKGEVDKFYENFILSLERGVPIQMLIDQKPYSDFKGQPRFLEILKKYSDKSATP